jgi:hypothetical protein
MPAMSTRHLTIRKIDQAVNNMDWAGTHLNWIIETYQKDHPEISDSVTTIVKLLGIVQESIISLREEI